MQPFVDKHTLAGAVTLVASKDKVLSLEAVGFADVEAGKPMRPDALFWIASQSKPITATALMMLVDEGKVKLDDPVEKYLPEFRNQWLAVYQDKDAVLLKRPKQPITVRDVLSHTSGLPFRSAMEEPTLDGLPLRDAVKSYAMTPLKFEPGTKYEYSNAGINTAGRIIEVVSGMPYEDFLDKRLFGPLGMKDTTFWPNEEQLGRLAKSYRPTSRQDGPGGDHDRPAQISAERPQAPADARGRPVFDRSRRGPLLPDDPERRHVRRQTLPLRSRREADDEQANAARGSRQDMASAGPRAAARMATAAPSRPT